MAHEPFEKLAVWQRSIELVESIYQLTREFPADEKSGLAAALRRSATAIPAKIADAVGQEDPAKTQQGLGAARGMIRELQTYAVICRRMRFLGYLSYSSLRRRLKKIDVSLLRQIDILDPEELPEESQAPQVKPMTPKRRPSRSLAA